MSLNNTSTLHESMSFIHCLNEYLYAVALVSVVCLLPQDGSPLKVTVGP